MRDVGFGPSIHGAWPKGDAERVENLQAQHIAATLEDLRQQLAAGRRLRATSHRDEHSHLRASQTARARQTRAL
jgi:hypothetical protein